MKEIPIIKFVAWTQENLREDYNINKIIKFIDAVKEEFQVTAIYGGKLTKKKNKLFDCENEDDIFLLRNCLMCKDVFVITLTNSDRKKREYIFGISISLSLRANIVDFGVSHSYFTSKERKEKFLWSVKELIEISNPMFARVDDIGNSIEIMDEMGEETYKVHEYIPAIFWGNYFGEKYIQQYGREKLLNAPVGKKEILGNGIFITMTDDLMEYNTKQCVDSRKKLTQYLNIGKYKIFKKIFNKFQ